MKHHLWMPLAMLLLVFAGTEDAFAQTKKNADGYSLFTPADLQSATLNDIEPEAGEGITSYTVTLACDKKELQELACTGDTLSTAFYSLVKQENTKRCLCYFDKIMAGNAPRKGFVIEVVPK